MVITSIGQYSLTVTLDVIQAAAVLQMLHLGLTHGMDEDVAHNMSALGTEIEADSVVLQLGQVIDSISRAIQMDVYSEDCHGDKAGEGLIEEGTTETEDTKPAKETIN
jgi:hypothetical protein